MKIIISPTKKMTITTDDFLAQQQPEFLTKATQILVVMQEMDFDSLQKMWNCSTKLAQENHTWLKQIDLTKNIAPAITSFVGIQYQYMAPDLLTEAALNYLQEYVRILSGFYGILRPFDAITKYRLEMQSRLPINPENNLYKFWGNLLYQALNLQEQDFVINLASKEYSDSIRPYLTKSQPMIDLVFATKIKDKLVVKATLAKMARGEMVRYLAENQITQIEQIKNFDHPDYQFSDVNSTPTKLVFLYQK